MTTNNNKTSLVYRKSKHHKETAATIVNIVQTVTMSRVPQLDPEEYDKFISNISTIDGSPIETSITL